MKGIISNSQKLSWKRHFIFILRWRFVLIFPLQSSNEIEITVKKNTKIIAILFNKEINENYFYFWQKLFEISEFCNMCFVIWYSIKNQIIIRKAAKNINSFYWFPYLIWKLWIYLLLAMLFNSSILTFDNKIVYSHTKCTSSQMQLLINFCPLKISLECRFYHRDCNKKGKCDHEDSSGIYKITVLLK